QNGKGVIQHVNQDGKHGLKQLADNQRDYNQRHDDQVLGAHAGRAFRFGPLIANCIVQRLAPYRDRPVRRRVENRGWENQIMKVDLWPVDGPMPPTRAPSRWRRLLESHLPSVVIYLMVATLVAVVLYPHMVITVPSGQVDVLWKRFGGGTVLDPRKLKNEGFHLIL